MRNNISLPLLACLLLAQPARADEAETTWMTVAGNASFQWQGKRGSGHLIHVGGKKNSAYAYIYQKEDKQNTRFSYGKVFVALDACRKGYGHVVYNDMEGKFTGKDSFVRFGRTMADALGSMACTSWDSDTGKASRTDSGDAWRLVAQAKESGNTFSLKTDTVRQRPYGGKPALAALFSYESTKKSTVEYGEYVIPLADCQSGFGTVYELDFDEKLIEKSDVALDGQSVISAVAKALCGLRGT